MVKQNAAAAATLARQLSSDERLRHDLLRAYNHAVQASRLARWRFGRLAPLREIAADQELRMELAQMLKELQDAHKQVNRKRSHRLRNGLFVVAGAGAATAIAWSRSRRVSYQQQNSPGAQGPEPQPQDEQAEQEERAA